MRLHGSISVGHVHEVNLNPREGLEQHALLSSAQKNVIPNELLYELILVLVQELPAIFDDVPLRHIFCMF